MANGLSLIHICVMTAVDTLTYNENEIRRIAIKGFDIAMKRRKKVTSVDTVSYTPLIKVRSTIVGKSLRDLWLHAWVIPCLLYTSLLPVRQLIRTGMYFLTSPQIRRSRWYV